MWLCSSRSVGWASSPQVVLLYLPVVLLVLSSHTALLACLTYPAEPVRKLGSACKLVNELLLYRSRSHDRIRIFDVA